VGRTAEAAAEEFEAEEKGTTGEAAIGIGWDEV